MTSIPGNIEGVAPLKCSDVKTWVLTGNICPLSFSCDIITYFHPAPPPPQLDPNREVGEATLNVSEALEAYKTYHECLRNATEQIGNSARQYGLVMDIHGHAHAMNWTEIGA